MRLIIVLFISISYTSIVFSQKTTEEEIIQMFGPGLSDIGIDTLKNDFNYDLFYNMEDENQNFLSYERKELIAHNYYKSKLCDADLIIIDRWMHNMTLENISEIMHRREYYSSGLDLMKERMDSFELMHKKTLDSFCHSIKLQEIFNETELYKLQYINNLARSSVYKSQRESLKFDQAFTLHIDSSTYLFKAYTFKILEKFPNTFDAKYNGGNVGYFDFINKIELEEFFEFYQNYENSFIKLINRLNVDEFFLQIQKMSLSVNCIIMRS